MTDDSNRFGGLNDWLARIRDRELPIFGRTAEQIRELTDSDKAAVSQLADAILHDPGMTAKLLRIANSVIFNTSGVQITTVSRAVVMLGFDMVRQVALSVAFVDALLRGPVRERVLREMARACHAAVQARWLAARRHDAQPEEVFIAALLYRFGEMAFWCFAGEAGDELDEAMRLNPQHPGDVEQSLLGFRLHQLTIALMRDWRVSPLLQGVLKGSFPKRSREQAVVLAYRLAEGSEGGWGNEHVRARLKEAADYLQLPVEDIAEAVKKNALEATVVAECYGAGAAARFIPQ
ncbi:MAG: HDOD domain-containing protein [Rhodocyclaceae bacterium]|nr:HDOD domain-containing protein [Rhodocyclaceae bacterium]